MGVVYRARQLSLGRDVAIKTLPFASVLDPKQIKRFQNEAQAAGQLHHPNIVPVYAVGCERGVHYYSMQLIEGLSLEQVITDLRAGSPGDVRHQTTIVQPVDPEESYRERRSLNRGAETTVENDSATFASVRNRRHIESSVRLITQAAEALHYAHQCGVIHRDIKPSNLMLDDRSNLWITDFGLARCQQTTPMSVTGDLMGTLRYMSPEQALGKVHAVDHRTDIYALGVTLYELLTLRHAFDAANRLELISLINQTSPVRPRKLNPAIPNDLETILCKAIAREPLDRYESAGDFAEDLQRFMNGEAPLATRPSMLECSVKWLGRHQYLFLALAAASMFIILGLSISTVVISAHRRTAVVATDRAELHLNQSNKVVHHFGNLVIERLRDAGEGQEVRAQVLGELKNYYLDFLEYANSQNEMKAQVGEAHLRLADVYREESQWGAAIDHLEQTIESLTHREHTKRNVLQADTLLVRAYAMLAEIQASDDHWGDWQASINNAITLQKQLVERTPADASLVIELAALKCQHGDVWLQKQNEDQAVLAFEQAIELVKQALAQPLETDARARALALDSTCHNNLASVHQQTQPTYADQLLKHAIESGLHACEWQPSSAKYREQLANAYTNAAILAQQERDNERAEACFSAAVDQGRQLIKRYPRNDGFRIELATNLNSLGQFLVTESRFVDAEVRFRDAIALLESPIHVTLLISPTVLSDLASVQNNLGLCLERQQQWDRRSVLL
jgi:eukaryotic-like serine/threonine-protein kinase